MTKELYWKETEAPLCQILEKMGLLKEGMQDWLYVIADYDEAAELSEQGQSKRQEISGERGERKRESKAKERGECVCNGLDSTLCFSY